MLNKDIEPYVVEKKKELQWAIASQGYNTRQIAYILNVSRSQAHNIIQSIPKGWKSPWKKQ